ncbi:Transcription factor STP1, partial [Frankliniella fusca]
SSLQLLFNVFLDLFFRKLSATRAQRGKRDLNANVTISSDISITPSTPGFFSSTPFGSKRKNGKNAFVRPICDVCQYCGKNYRCHRSYVKHIKGHKLQESAACYPNLEEIMTQLCSCTGVMVRKLAELPQYGVIGAKYNDLLLSLSSGDFSTNNEWDLFTKKIYCAITEGINDSKFLMPSSVITVLQRNCEAFLSKIEVRKQLEDTLQVCVQCESEIAQIFIADFSYLVAYDTLKVICDSIKRSRSQSAVINKTLVLDSDCLETVFYISGSVVRGFYKKAQKFVNNSSWRDIGKVITERLLESETVPGPPLPVKAWTLAQNRGKLFLLLEKDTSARGVNHDFIQEEVNKSCLPLLWDDAVSDSLHEDLSYKLMCGMVRSFSQTFGVGKAKKIMNAARKKADALVPLRHKVVPK